MVDPPPSPLPAPCPPPPPVFVPPGNATLEAIPLLKGPPPPLGDPPLPLAPPDPNCYWYSPVETAPLGPGSALGTGEKL